MKQLEGVLMLEWHFRKSMLDKRKLGKGGGGSVRKRREASVVGASRDCVARSKGSSIIMQSWSRSLTYDLTQVFTIIVTSHVREATRIAHRVTARVENGRTIKRNGKKERNRTKENGERFRRCRFSPPATKWLHPRDFKDSGREKGAKTR